MSAPWRRRRAPPAASSSLRGVSARAGCNARGIFLETMERVFGGMDKIIIDNNGNQGPCRCCRSMS